MSRISYGWTKRKWSRSLNSSAMSFDIDNSWSLSKYTKVSEPVIWYDSIPEDKNPIFANKKEREDRAQCIGEYMMYKCEKDKNKNNPFARFLR